MALTVMPLSASSRARMRVRSLDRGFRRGVGSFAFEIERDSDRRKVDNASKAVLLHQARGFLTQEECTKDVRFNDAPHRINWGKHGRIHRSNTRIVDERIEAALLFADGCHHFPDRMLVTDIEHNVAIIGVCIV